MGIRRDFYMAKLRIKCDLKKFERELNRSIDKIVKDKQKEFINENNLLGVDTMGKLSETEETMLLILLSKSDNGLKKDITGNCNEFPEYMHFNLKNIIEKLKLYDYISSGQVYISGDWHIVLTPDATELIFYIIIYSRLVISYRTYIETSTPKCSISIFIF